MELAGEWEEIELSNGPNNWSEVNYQAIIMGQQEKPEGLTLWPNTPFVCAYYLAALLAKSMLDPESQAYKNAHI